MTFTAISQSLPDKIRGYKVHRDKISVNAGTDNSDAHAAVKIGDPELVDVSLAGLTVELPAEFTATDQSGKVEFVTFHDVRVNGIRVEPEEYTHRFEFRKSEKVSIPKPVRILLPAYGVARAAWEEMTESRAKWIVTGRAFVFGRFRRFGLYHKRVVPIDLNLVIKNPIRN